jgi:[CysO sulfur-carrier protein]-S-L-cysteine hydrolase
MRIARSMLDQIVAQARDEAPNECCGIIGARNDIAARVFPVRNAAASPLRYEMDPKDQLRVFEALDDDDLDVGAIYHSHTRSDPLPSQTDINLAFYPDAVYVILGVKDADRDDVRAWRIVDGKVSETALEVEED